MKTITKILLYYSTILSLFIFVIGLVTSKSNISILTSLFYLPVLLYLLYSVFKKKSPEITEKLDATMMTAIGIFIIFFLIGICNIYNANKKLEDDMPIRDTSPIIIQRHE